MLADPLAEQLAVIIRGIGIDVTTAALPERTPLPGMDIRHGAIVVDESRRYYPGDLLHEAGHLAVTHPDQRRQPMLSPTGGDELATIAWSYAAALHFGIDIEILFHPVGYRGESSALIENFTAGRYIGVPLLHAYGMTVEPRRAAAGVLPYPHMLRWLR
jgi:hypothetical protein